MGVIDLARDSSKAPSTDGRRFLVRGGNARHAGALPVHGVVDDADKGYFKAIVKLIPAETLAIYMLLSGGFTPTATTGKVLITVGTFASVPFFGWIGNRIARKTKPGQTRGWMGASAFSALALAFYLCAYPNSVFSVAGLSLHNGTVIAAIGAVVLPKVGQAFDVEGLR